MVRFGIVRVGFDDHHRDQVEAVVLDRTGGAAACHGVRADDRSRVGVEPVAGSLTLWTHAIPLPARGQIGAPGGAEVDATRFTSSVIS